LLTLTKNGERAISIIIYFSPSPSLLLAFFLTYILLW
jgi:hypothetical protein